MVAQLLGLKFTLLANTFRRSRWQVVGVLVAVLYGSVAAAAVVIGFLALQSADVALARSVVVVVGSAIVLGFLLVPLAFGVDDTLDPRKFAPFPISTSKLATLLALSGFLGVPALIITAVAVAQIATWSRGGTTSVLAVLGAVVIVTTCVLAARVSTSLGGWLLSARRAREVSGLIALVALVCLSPSILLLTGVNWDDERLEVLDRIVDALSWTPLGAAWAAPADAAAGDPGSGLWKLLIAVAFLAILWLCWRALVARMLVSPHREFRGPASKGLGWFNSLPARPVWAVAARSLTYWARDGRYRAQLVIIPLLPALMVVVLLIAGVYWRNLALLPLPVMCLFLGWSMHNDVAFDNSAVWLHVASHTSGVADRLGRVLPVVLIGVPLIGVGAPISALLYGDSSVLLSLIGVCSCVLLCGLGIGSLTSARFPYPVVRPGDNPFTQPQGSGGSAVPVQTFTFIATVALTVPPLLFGLYGLVDHGSLPLQSLILGLSIGLLTFSLGVWGGGRVFERRGPELLEFTLRN